LEFVIVLAPLRKHGPKRSYTEDRTLSKQFRRNYSDPTRGPDGKSVAKYRALKLTCQACPSKAKCCPNADFRSITCEEHEDARQVARDIAKTKQYTISMRLRKKVEMLFAHLGKDQETDSPPTLLAKPKTTRILN